MEKSTIAIQSGCLAMVFSASECKRFSPESARSALRYIAAEVEADLLSHGIDRRYEIVITERAARCDDPRIADEINAVMDRVLVDRADKIRDAFPLVHD